MIDAHCHLDSPKLDPDRDKLLAAARAAGVEGWVVAGVEPDSWERQRALADATDGVKALYGIHPWVAARMGPGDLERDMERLAGVAELAVGETGLDTSKYVPRGSLPRQIDAFRAQLELARGRDLPVVLHVLGAHGQVCEILEADGVPKAGGMVHSYSGSAEMVARYERLGLHISFSASITRPTARKALEAARAVSEGRLLVETDCPDQRPHDRSGARNLPEWLTDVVAAVAQARGESTEAVARRTAQNARDLFGSF